MTPAEAETLGHEAVKLEFPCQPGIRDGVLGRLSEEQVGPGTGWFREWPDFRDELTALACIPWVRSVWPRCTVEVTQWIDGTARVQIWDEVNFCSLWSSETDESLAHACIAAVKAAKRGAE